MKAITLFSFLLLSFGVIAQQNSRSLELKGTGTVKMMPDQGSLFINVSTHQMEMNKAISELDKKTVEIFKLLEKAGFKREDIKTIGYNVNKHTIYRNGQPRDSGYVGRQQLNLEFPYKKETTAKILSAFADQAAEAQLRFSFNMSDAKMKEVREMLIKDAIRDARQKAELIAEESAVSLGEISEIKYGEPEQAPIRFERAAMMETQDGRNRQPQGFDIREAEFTDTVWIKWNLEQ
ncbi:SIMPL domain-containing protein [Cytophagaceae bacterium ABcell3]|nr:SIMPL domain-containing protein [Cytophagaceae bacterium ABcell3]